MLIKPKFKQFLVGTLLLLVVVNAFSAGKDNSLTQSNWTLEGHRKAINDTFLNDDVMHGEVNFVFGNHIWQPGESFKKGDNWLGLACKKDGCTLEPATLSVKKETWEGHYDDQPTMGQKLNFKLNNNAQNVSVIAWFRTTEAPIWLKAGAVTTFHSIINPPKKASSKGSFDVELNFPNNNKATLVPILSMDSTEKSIYLQLRTPTKRQLLLGQLGTCSGLEVLGGEQKFLQWVGDLDRDGNADYLISFIDVDGPVHLYLSSVAKNNDLVGLAGIYRDKASDFECDGGLWE